MAEFKINKTYAEIYNKRREKEELQKLKDKYGENADVNGESSSSSESEDSDAEALTPEVEKDWLKTLAAIKSHDPKIYDPKVTFYHPNDDDSTGGDQSNDATGRASSTKRIHCDKGNKSKTEKPMFLKDFERKVIIEREGKFSSDDDDDDDDDRPKPAGYYAEQEAARASFKAFAEDDDSDDDQLLTERKISSEQQVKEELAYVEWLKGTRSELIGADEQIGSDLKSLQKVWADPNLPEDEKFLRDFILDKTYLDNEQDDRLPTYAEIVNEDEEAELLEDAAQLEKQEIFENKYNFRYEEPDADFIKSYPRTIANSVRNKDSRRAERRRLAKERKQKLLEKKHEELKRLKNLKKKEILDKISTLKQVTGNRSIGFAEEDLEADLDGEFDPKQHDKLMKKVLGSNYYDDDEVDDVKPVFDDNDINDEFNYDDENWDNWKRPGEDYQEEDWENSNADAENEATLHCDHPDFNMDADYVPKQKKKSEKKVKSKTQNPVVDTGISAKKRKSKFAEAVEKKKPVFDPNEKTFDEYIDEYYKLDYEDIIDDLPVRFHYRKVVPNDFGLTTDEILRANDKELNSWVSVKRMSQYRTKEDEELDVRIYRRKASNKLKVLTSLVSAPSDDEEHQSSTTKKKKKKKKARKDSSAAVVLKESCQITDEKMNKNLKKDRSTTDLVVHGDPAKRQRLDTSENPKNIAMVEPAKSFQGPSESVAIDSSSVSHKKKRKHKKESKQDSLLQEGLSVETLSGSSPKRKKMKESIPSTVQDNLTLDENVSNIKNKMKKKSKKSKILAISDDRLKSYGINPKKYKYVYLQKLKSKDHNALV